jgi:double-stranded uracil-DNA glycosylase
VLFVGINPGVRSAETGHHFAGFSNRFWKLLFESGLVPERLTWEDDVRLPEFGFGITNLVAAAEPGDRRPRAVGVRGRLEGTRAQGEALPPASARAGRRDALPRDPAAGGPAPPARRRIPLGPQPLVVHGARVFVLPNPSGRNANFSYVEMLEAFQMLRASLARGKGER